MFLNGEINLKNEENETFSPQNTFRIQKQTAMSCLRGIVRWQASMAAVYQ